MKIFKYAVCVIFLLLMTAASMADDMLKVRVFNKYHPRRVEIIKQGSTSGIIISLYGKDKLKMEQKGREKVYTKKAVLYDGSYGLYSITGEGITRDYLGAVEALRLENEDEVCVIIKTRVNDYIPGVLSGEIDDEKYTLQSARALSVLIRTYAYYNRGRHGIYDLCDLTHCQVFRGVPEKFMFWKKIAEDTGNEIIVHKKDRSINIAYYSICCGGILENECDMWRDNCPDKPVRRDVLDNEPLCSYYRYYKWEKQVKKREMNEIIRDVMGKRVSVKNVEVYEKTNAGRVKELKVYYGYFRKKDTAVIKLNRFFTVFGKRYGWARIPSKAFTIKKDGADYVLEGRGHGHGVGMCKAGAATLAKKGYNYRDILKFYFPDGIIINPDRP